MPDPDVAAHPPAPLPPAAVAAAVLAFVGALPVLYLALVIWALGGLSSDGGDRGWALLPLAAALAQVWGGVRLLRGQGWRLLAMACLPATVVVGWLVVDSVSAGQPPPLGPLLLVLTPVVALGLALTPPVRHWIDARRDSGPAHGR
jgi:hypothetical protein